ncbi:N-acetylmuramoyl-L-alanine amidase [Sphingobacterium sp. lm-10]|uniref:N-acetylmuramoyl-L-alanine amidase n=1 Tax=Sphingobacterium sp. lm-10 TaxID=2944904 RepID=UPI002020B8D8|nr:N-acetylmuramoyl-L-alanine amidase [Sphingobacterium sp. lm-10]MCL7987723.1 N-acetylmuramoyl-L-alanine amidase [Sphingobacterium sp. lm-10]MCL8000780.1 N-acetylmuramoyl-L-alanine amidase [Brucella sp. 21LCYQ03]
MRKINRIVLHTTAGWAHETPESIQRMWRVNLGWKNPGYHILIPTDGNLVHLADIIKVTNGVAGYNSDSVHVSYIGGLVEIKNGKYIYGDTRTSEQKDGFWSAIEYFYKEIKKHQDIGHITIVGHRDLSPDLNGNGIIEQREWIKVCPTFNAMEEYGWIAGHKALERMRHRKTY